MTIALLGLVATIAGVGFARSARLGRRVRAMAARRGRLDPQARSRVVVGSLAGVVVAGIPGMVLGVVGSALWGRVGSRARERKAEAALAEQVPGVARALAAGLRAGLNIPLALEAARDGSSEPIRSILSAAVARSRAGLAPDAALGDIRALRDVAASLRLGAMASADLPSILDATAEALQERERIARDRRAATAQGRMSAWIVAAMPLAFFVVAGSGARAQVGLLATEPAGWALLTIGLALEATGIVWMRALTRMP